jgi:hypothetical protein
MTALWPTNFRRCVFFTIFIFANVLHLSALRHLVKMCLLVLGGQFQLMVDLFLKRCFLFGQLSILHLLSVCIFSSLNMSLLDVIVSFFKSFLLELQFVTLKFLLLGHLVFEKLVLLLQVLLFIFHYLKPFVLI